MPLNHGYTYRERLGPEAEGRDLLAYLTERHRHSDEITWRARIEAGEVTLEARATHAAAPLRRGQLLAWQRPPWEEPQVPLAFAILHRDEHLLALAKPRGLPTLPNGGFLEHTLLHLVRAYDPEATPLHRLGRGTSGLVLCARTPLARRGLAGAWHTHVRKSYLALVQGHPERTRFDVEVPIGRVPHTRLAEIHGAHSAGRPAHTEVRVLATRGPDCLIEAIIPTGRPHQIRIHLAAAGHPLVGDPLYSAGGQPDPARPALPGDGGYHLHAHRLRLRHPASGRDLEIECLPPPSLRP
jgi:23S rRNA pseudouridine1911/1915/1917 synthase